MQPQPTRILIVDDEPDRAKSWEKGIKNILGDMVQVEAPDIEETKKLVSSIFVRRKKMRELSGPDLIASSGIDCLFDGADIVILDYDLQNLEKNDDSEWATGAEVAIAARGYSTSGMLVLANSMGINRFDLTMTKGISSRADLDIGSEQILNPGLWSPDKAEGFRPWHWPVMLEWPKRYLAAVEWLSKRLDNPIFKELGLEATGDGDAHVSSDQWVDYLGIDPKTTTFRSLVRTHQYLPIRDRDVVAGSDGQCARVAAAIIKGWFDRVLVPSQETVIDAPHLAYQMPWLLRDANDVACWKDAADLAGCGNAFKIDLSEFTYQPNSLASRPVYFRKRFLNNAKAAEPHGFNYADTPDLVFCEDVSAFVEFTISRPFPSSLPGSDRQRFVADPEKVASPEGPQRLNNVDYEPSSLFAL